MTSADDSYLHSPQIVFTKFCIFFVVNITNFLNLAFKILKYVFIDIIVENINVCIEKMAILLLYLVAKSRQGLWPHKAVDSRSSAAGQSLLCSEGGWSHSPFLTLLSHPPQLFEEYTSSFTMRL